ncbi:hypothetical protein BJ138DRAFT_1120362 [Hygrophoropsis aurantiaca]|uniref:Uncharacterized protein n=1 Tax=Hygrophoropsis aurantiaca TaxID=72124 RepID=A0ACB7ZQV7_9AGAM|nr:hypothetical protein BJ138DRAFT_1120362 [Hygrophoropsis aurantiaca]
MDKLMDRELAGVTLDEAKDINWNVSGIFERLCSFSDTTFPNAQFLNQRFNRAGLATGNSESDLQDEDIELYDEKEQRWNWELCPAEDQERLLTAPGEDIPTNETQVEQSVAHLLASTSSLTSIPSSFLPASSLATSSKDGELESIKGDRCGTSTDEWSDVSGRPKRRGAACDGDDTQDGTYTYSGSEPSSDPTYLERLDVQKPAPKPSPPTFESHFGGFLNTISSLLADRPYGPPPPPHHPQSISDAIDLIADAPYIGASGYTQPPRTWNGSFSTKKLPVPEGQAGNYNRKPDLILLEHGLINFDGVDWSTPKAGAELTVSTWQANTTILRSLNTKSYLLFLAQPWRRYVLALTFANDEVRLHLYDRSGAVISRPHNFHRKFNAMIRLVYLFAHADRALLGFDPTIQISPLPSRGQGRPIGTVEGSSPGIIYNIWAMLMSTNGFVGRGTVCYHIRLSTSDNRTTDAINGGAGSDADDLVLKDYWAAKGLETHEATILDLLKGLDGVPELVDAWNVQFEGEDDTTFRNRPLSQSFNFSLWPNLVCRMHRRMVMRPLAYPITTFRSQIEFLSAFCGIVRVHKSLVARKILHCDISPNNMMLRDDPRLKTGMNIEMANTTYSIKKVRQHVTINKPDGETIDIAKNGDIFISKGNETTKDTSTAMKVFVDTLIAACVRLGLLIDFDYAQYITENGIFGPRGTGTLPYVSLEILFALRQLQTRRGKGMSDATINFEIADDLEAFFYVFIWICVMHHGPGCEPPPEETFKRLVVYDWSEGMTSEHGLHRAYSAKLAFLCEDDSIKAEISPYFLNLAPVAEKWKMHQYREVLRRQKDRKAGVRSDPTLTHDHIIRYLEEAIEIAKMRPHNADLLEFHQHLTAALPKDSSDDPLADSLPHMIQTHHTHLQPIREVPELVGFPSAKTRENHTGNRERAKRTLDVDQDLPRKRVRARSLD